jgi:hypothetical protein
MQDETIELDQDTAERVNVDSPGVLVEYEDLKKLLLIVEKNVPNYKCPYCGKDDFQDGFEYAQHKQEEADSPDRIEIMTSDNWGAIKLTEHRKR